MIGTDRLHNMSWETPVSLDIELIIAGSPKPFGLVGLFINQHCPELGTGSSSIDVKNLV